MRLFSEASEESDLKRITLLFCLVLLAPIGHTEEGYLAARALVESGEILSLEQILTNLDERMRGRVLEVEFEREHGRYIYEIEILDASGIVRELEIDATSGELLQIERED